MRSPLHRRKLRAFSLISLVISVGCIAVLLVIMMQSLSSVTGKSQGARSTMSNFQDGHNLSQIYQVLAIDGMFGDRPGFPIPSEEVRNRGDVSQNTSANVWAAIVAKGVPAQMLVARTEPSLNVEVYSGGQFVADLDNKSNVSFAHVPLYGDRFGHWKRPDDFPLIGHRGPKDGVDLNSYTWGGDGTWSGQVLFGDGHIEELSSMVLWQGDNLFIMEDGVGGGDAFLSFTTAMSASGPSIQHD